MSVKEIATKGAVAVAAASLALAGAQAVGLPQGAPAATQMSALPAVLDRDTMPRTIVTTDGEWDDQNSFIRLLYYSNELDIDGLVYGSAVHHWKGDGVHTLKEARAAGILPNYRGQVNRGTGLNSEDATQWRWEPTGWIEEYLHDYYSEIYPNLLKHDPNYPSPAELWSKVAVGNITFESEYQADTEGSDLIKRAILDEDPRTLYLQAWGGTNTIARALKSIEDQHKGTAGWEQLQAKINKKVVIPALGFQDVAYADYISKAWPGVKVLQMSGSGINSSCLSQATAETRPYCQGPFMATNLKYGHGPLLNHYALFGDGKMNRADRGPEANWSVHANPRWDPSAAKDMSTYRLYDRTAAERLDFAGEGDSPTYLFLIDNGLRAKEDLTLGSWGGRMAPSATNPNLWTSQGDINPETKAATPGYAIHRWWIDIQNDFAARADWGITPNYSGANHQPAVQIVKGDVSGKPGQTVTVRANATDPDNNKVKQVWSVYAEATTASGDVTIANATNKEATITIPATATAGQRIVVNHVATDDGVPALSRYAQVIITVQ